jgi:hypothetical protein
MCIRVENKLLQFFSILLYSHHLGQLAPFADLGLSKSLIDWLYLIQVAITTPPQLAQPVEQQFPRL